MRINVDQTFVFFQFLFQAILTQCRSPLFECRCLKNVWESGKSLSRTLIAWFKGRSGEMVPTLKYISMEITQNWGRKIKIPAKESILGGRFFFSKKLLFTEMIFSYRRKIHSIVQPIPWVTERINFVLRRTDRVTKRIISATEPINSSHKKSFRSFKRSIRPHKSSFSPSARSLSLQKKSFPWQKWSFPS